MATKSEIKGVTAHRKKPVIVPVEDDPANQFRSKDEFIKIRAAQKAAKQAGEEARQRVLAEYGATPVASVSENTSPSQEKLEKLRKALANAEKNLSVKPDSKAWAKKVKALSEELEVAEAESID